MKFILFLLTFYTVYAYDDFRNVKVKRRGYYQEEEKLPEIPPPLGPTYDSVMEYLNMLDTLEPCDYRVLEDAPSVDEIPDEPFVIKNYSYNMKNTEHMTFDYFYNRYKRKIIGVDTPGSQAPPTKDLRLIELGDYFNNYMLPLEELPYEKVRNEYKNLTQTYLWGPTSGCAYIKQMFPHRLDEIEGCLWDAVDADERGHYQFFLHIDDQKKFDVNPWAPDTKLKTEQTRDLLNAGISGRLQGLNFHQHTHIANHLVWGKVVWFMYEPKLRVKDEERSALDMIDIMVNDYMKHAEFRRPRVCVQTPGDLIHVPDMWNHMTINLQTSFKYGFTHFPEYKI